MATNPIGNQGHRYNLRSTTRGQDQQPRANNVPDTNTNALTPRTPSTHAPPAGRQAVLPQTATNAAGTVSPTLLTLPNELLGQIGKHLLDAWFENQGETDLAGVGLQGAALSCKTLQQVFMPVLHEARALDLGAVPQNRRHTKFNAMLSRVAPTVSSLAPPPQGPLPIDDHKRSLVIGALGSRIGELPIQLRFNAMTKVNAAIATLPRHTQTNALAGLAIGIGSLVTQESRLEGANLCTANLVNVPTADRPKIIDGVISTIGRFLGPPQPIPQVGMWLYNMMLGQTDGLPLSRQGGRLVGLAELVPVLTTTGRTLNSFDEVRGNAPTFTGQVQDAYDATVAIMQRCDALPELARLELLLEATELVGFFNPEFNTSLGQELLQKNRSLPLEWQWKVLNKFAELDLDPDLFMAVFTDCDRLQQLLPTLSGEQRVRAREDLDEVRDTLRVVGYSVMSDVDRAEVDRRLAALGRSLLPPTVGSTSAAAGGGS